MRRWFVDLDRLLRGDATRPGALRDGHVPVAPAGLTAVSLVLGLAYGFCMGGFALFSRDEPEFRQVLASMLKVPMLFLQGTRDTLADLTLLRPLCERLAPLATLHVVDGADHSFHMLKRAGKTNAEVLSALARTVASWGDTRM